jgi:sec-independent protein translocase protein TatC
MLTVVSCISIFCVSYVNKEILLFLILNSCSVTKNLFNLPYFIFTNVTEIFEVYLKVTFFLSTRLLFFSSVYQSFAFLSTAIFNYEYIFLRRLFRVTLLVWVFSFTIFNSIIIPITWDYFLSFNSLLAGKFISLYFEASLEESLRFYFSMHTVFNLYCQVLIALFFMLNSVRFNHSFVQTYRKFFYYAFISISALLSPSDSFSQFFASFGTIFIYEILVVCFLFKSYASSANS